MPEFRMNYERRGKGAPPIVFVHGYLCRLEDWRHQVSHFEKTNATWAVDLRGMGRSPLGNKPMMIETLGQDVADFLAAENITGAVLVGHSMGCRVVTETAARAPDRVAGLVMVDGSRQPGEINEVYAAYDKALSEKGFEKLVTEMFAGMFFGTPPAWAAEKLAQVAAMPESTAVPLSKNMVRHDKERMPAAMAAVKAPVLVIQATDRGSRGGRRPVKPGERLGLQQLVEDSGVTCDAFTHVGPGHFNMIEDPATVNARIKQFIRERIKG
jgi:pimeloyl-ACP methyl ester carboxylesterase